jgi:hypothetical protein
MTKTESLSQAYTGKPLGPALLHHQNRRVMVFSETARSEA